MPEPVGRHRRMPFADRTRNVVGRKYPLGHIKGAARHPVLDLNLHLPSAPAAGVRPT